MIEPNPMDYRPTNCRSCNAPVVWATTSRRKAMPVDIEPSADGNLTLHDRGGALRVVVSPPPDQPDLFANQPRYKSHFATCPQGKQWRHPK